MRMNSQTRIIVATAFVLAAVDIGVRLHTAPRSVQNDVVTAREFRLTDDRGNVKATLSVDRAGEPGLKMYDRSGALRLQLDTYETTPSIIFFDRDENRRAYYGMGSPDGDGELTMLSPGGREVATLRVDGDRSLLSVSENGGSAPREVRYWDGVAAPSLAHP